MVYPRDWIEFPVLYSRTSLLIHSEWSRLHPSTPNSQAIPLRPLWDIVESLGSSLSVPNASFPSSITVLSIPLSWRFWPEGSSSKFTFLSLCQGPLLPKCNPSPCLYSPFCGSAWINFIGGGGGTRQLLALFRVISSHPTASTSDLHLNLAARSVHTGTTGLPLKERHPPAFPFLQKD